MPRGTLLAQPALQSRPMRLSSKILIRVVMSPQGLAEVCQARAGAVPAGRSPAVGVGRL
jgi:hypothetical protein